jgi:hypothetical protein
MKVEKDDRQRRVRYRFDVNEIQKYAGKDIPHTVIKRWINQGKLFDSTLSTIEKRINQLIEIHTQENLAEQIEDLKVKQNETHKLIENFTEVFINLSRVFLISSAIQSRNLRTMDKLDRQAVKRFDTAFKHISTDLFPEIKNDIFFNILVERDDT